MHTTTHRPARRHYAAAAALLVTSVLLSGCINASGKVAGGNMLLLEVGNDFTSTKTRQCDPNVTVKGVTLSTYVNTPDSYGSLRAYQKPVRTTVSRVPGDPCRWKGSVVVPDTACRTLFAGPGTSARVGNAVTLEVAWSNGRKEFKTLPVVAGPDCALHLPEG